MRKKMQRISLWLVLPLSLSLIGNAATESPHQSAQEKGLSIAKESDRRDWGWEDSSAQMTMILKNKQGETSERKIRTKNLEVRGDGDKGLTIFDKPRDVKGTAFLTHTHVNKPDDQWLYLPALKRVKRISSSNKSGPFMGSEFSYEDLSSFEVDKYQYQYLRDDVVNGEPAFVVEFYPQYKFSGYTRMIAWIDQAEYRIQKTEFYDRKDSLLKTLIYSDYQQYLNQYWRPGKMMMENHQTGKSTELYFENYEFKQGLTHKNFNKNILSRTK